MIICKLVKAILLFFMLAVIVSCSKSQKSSNLKSSKLESDKNDRIDQVFTSMKANGFTGGLLVAEKGDILYLGTSGYTNLLDSVAINENTMFELASVSKQFTAMGIALLEEEGRIDVGLSISTYLPDLIEYENITVKHLIHHTSGLPEYDDGDWVYDRTQFITNDSLINYLSRGKPPLLFEPGSQYNYSNTGYVMLASIIERVSGMSFGEFLKRHIFDSIGMSRSTLLRPRYDPKWVDNYAVGFVYSDSLQKNVIPDDHAEHDYVVHLDGIQGDGMVNSTLLDLLKWDRALYGSKIVNAEVKQKLFVPPNLSDGTENNYGYGWNIEHDELFGKIVNHAGGWPGYVTFIERYIETDKTIIILQNNFNNFKFSTKLLRVIVHSDIIPSFDKKDLVGKYQFEDDQSILNIIAQKDTLVGEYDGDMFNLIQIKESVFFVEDQQSIEVEFLQDSTEVISNVIWNQGDYVGKLKRIE